MQSCMNILTFSCIVAIGLTVSLTVMILVQGTLAEGFFAVLGRCTYSHSAQALQEHYEILNAVIVKVLPQLIGRCSADLNDTQHASISDAGVGEVCLKQLQDALLKQLRDA